MPYDPYKHHRQSARLKGYDYTQAGAYFVTVCTYKRQPLFGKIVDGQMQLSLLGQLVYAEWQKTAVVRPNVFLDAFVVMPNHLHGIIVIFLNETTHVGATRRVAPTSSFAHTTKLCPRRASPAAKTPGTLVQQKFTSCKL